jgi:hypothetical protein
MKCEDDHDVELGKNYRKWARHRVFDVSVLVFAGITEENQENSGHCITFFGQDSNPVPT